MNYFIVMIQKILYNNYNNKVLIYFLHSKNWLIIYQNQIYNLHTGGHYYEATSLFLS